MERVSARGRQSKFVGLLIKKIVQMILLPASRIIVEPTPYGKFVTDKSTARVLAAMFDFIEREVQGFFEQQCRKARIFIDVGAQFGWYTLKASRKIENPCLILSIEPDEYSFNILLANIRINKLRKIVPVKVALSDTDGYLRLNGKIVECKRLDSLLRALNVDYDKVDLIKIDVEGMALSVLEGAVETLNKGRPCLLIELHGGQENQAIRFLEKLGYKINVVTGLESALVSGLITACK